MESKQFAQGQKYQRVHGEDRYQKYELNLVGFDLAVTFYQNGLILTLYFISDVILLRYRDEAFDLGEYHREQGHECKEDESEEAFVVFFADAVVEPLAVVVESVDAEVTK